MKHVQFRYEVSGQSYWLPRWSATAAEQVLYGEEETESEGRETEAERRDWVWQRFDSMLLLLLGQTKWKQGTLSTATQRDLLFHLFQGIITYIPTGWSEATSLVHLRFFQKPIKSFLKRCYIRETEACLRLVVVVIPALIIMNHTQAPIELIFSKRCWFLIHSLILISIKSRFISHLRVQAASSLCT